MLVNLGLSYVRLDQVNQGVELYQQALPIFRQTNNQDGEGVALNNLCNAFRLLKQYDKAISHCQQALPLLQQTENNEAQVSALGSLGTIYKSLQQYNTAIIYYKQALSISQKMQDQKAEFSTLISLGDVQDSLSHYDEAINYYEQALLVLQKVQDPKTEVMALNNLGVTYTKRSQYDKAIAYYEQALPIVQQTKDLQTEGSILLNLSMLYGSLGQPKKAITYLERALPIFQQFHNTVGVAKVLQNLGVAHANLAQPQKAIDYYKKALTIFQQLKDQSGEAHSLANIGNIYAQKFKQPDKALPYYQKALPIFQATGEQQDEAHILSAIGIAYGLLAQSDKGLAYFQQALSIFQRINDRTGEAGTLSNLAKIYSTKGNLAIAEEQLYRSIFLWESVRSDAGTDQNKVSIFEEQSVSYLALQAVLMVQNKIQPALEVAERGRARAFVELLAQRLTANQTPNAVSQPLIASTGNGSVASRIEAIAKPPTIQQIQQIAQVHKATLVEYSVAADKALFIWVIHPDGKIDFRQVDLSSSQSPLAQLVNSSRVALGARNRDTNIAVFPTPEKLQQLQEQQTRNLRQLHQLLIDPIADLLPQDPNQRVIFMPQGELFLVPFPALLNAQNQPLIAQHTILTAPSIQTLDLTHKTAQRHSNANRPALVVGNPTMPAVTMVIGDPPQKLSPLQGAEQEAIAIAKQLNVQALIGATAKKAAVVQKMQGAGIIHLATHGLLDSFKGDTLGAIALAPNGTGERNDGLLTSGEIFDLKLNADLVVLSACDTGRGEITGDGVIGLSRSLITAGVPSVIVSLWKVPDESTAFLMTEFYRNWRDRNLDKAQALRQAMLTTRAKHPQPLAWAAFTLIGEAE